MKRYERSAALYERAQRVLAGGVSSEFRKASQPHPLFFISGRGSHVIDADENDYLDFTLSQGPLLLGHGHPTVMAAVNTASEQGQLFAAQHLAELELAELIQRLVPACELLRFSLSGSEAVHTALRVARAVTGRSRFVRFEGQYHGWLDNVSFGVNGASEESLGPREQPTPTLWTAGLPPRVLEEALVLPWNDLALVERALEQHGHEIAAIITEPVMCNSGCIEPEPGYLAGLRALCDRYGCALIFDEVITGFRLGLGGAQEHYGVTPDLSIFAKAIASGYPLSVIAGRRHWMQPIVDGTVIHAGTLNGAVPAVAAALATIQVLEREAVHERLWALGQRLMDGLRGAAADAGQAVRVQGPGPMFQMSFVQPGQEHVRVVDYRGTLRDDRARYARFLAAMQERGVRLIGRGLWYLSAAHTMEEIDWCVAQAATVLHGMRG